MTKEQAQQLTKDLITSGQKHPDYDTVTALARKLKILITGKNSRELLKRVSSRETPEQFNQRVSLTKSITPAVAASTITPFYKVVRNNRIRKKLELSTPERTDQVKKMMEMFYGGKRRKNRGLEGWMKSIYVKLSFTDPNAWVVVEWDKLESPTQVPSVRPFVVSSHNALNFKVINGETKWLFVRQQVTFFKIGSDKAVISQKGSRFTLYEERYTIVFEEVDREYLRETNYQMREGQELFELGATTYLTEWYEHKVGFVPAIRVGYKTDLSTEDRTFVNPFEDGMCFFDKSIKVVSEFDLTMALHAFPQKLQYVDTCKGTATKRCNGGLVTGTSESCIECKGTGFQFHNSASDVIYRKMPTSPQDMIDLDKTLIYKAPPIDLIKFQNDYSLQLKGEVHQAVFNSQVFVKKNSNTSAGGSGAPIQTATENENNMESVYDALEPFTEHFSESYKDFIIVMGTLAGEEIEQITVEHVFPADPKMKTSSILLADLKSANDSGAPSFLKDTINNDLAEVFFYGDQLSLDRFAVRRRFFPFNGKTEAEIQILLGSQYVPTYSKVLYANFENIMSDLEFENPEFPLSKTDIKRQRDLVKAKVEEYVGMLELTTGLIAVDAFRAAMAGDKTGNGQDPNPGNDDKDPQNANVDNPID